VARRTAVGYGRKMSVAARGLCDVGQLAAKKLLT